MRKAHVTKAPRGMPVSRETTLNAPVGGLNTSKARTNSDPSTALELINWVPDVDHLRIRSGHASHATGMTGEIETLMAWRGMTSSKVKACVDEKIYDVTSNGAVGAAEKSSLTNNYWSWVNYSTSGASYLVCANGADAVSAYDGTTWTTPTLTGVTSADMIYVTTFKTRLWFVEKNSTSAWLLPVDVITGTVSEFDVGTQFRRGGNLVAISSWSFDSGEGPNDYVVFLSSEGDAIVYAMTDPSDATSISLKGRYYVGKPLGSRPFFTVGGELLVMTYGGIIPMSAAISTDKALLEEASISAPIRRDWADFTAAYGANAGWTLETHPETNLLIANVPVSPGATYTQVVFNIQTGAPAFWEGINGNSWLENDGTLFVGGTSGVVFTAETGSADNGEAIVASVLPAFNYFGYRGRTKQIKMVKPIIESNLDITAEVGIAVDYGDNPSVSTSQNAQSGGFTWDVSLWDGTDTWIGTSISKKWRTGSGVGTALSPYMSITVASDTPAQNLDFKLLGWDIVYEVGGVL